MNKNSQKNGSLIPGLAGFLAVACVVILWVALSRDKQAAETRRTSPPPIYTESRPEPVVESMFLPEPEFLPVDETVDESELPR